MCLEYQIGFWASEYTLMSCLLETSSVYLSASGLSDGRAFNFLLTPRPHSGSCHSPFKCIQNSIDFQNFSLEPFVNASVTPCLCCTNVVLKSLLPFMSCYDLFSTADLLKPSASFQFGVESDFPSKLLRP